LSSSISVAYTLSLHDALPIWLLRSTGRQTAGLDVGDSDLLFHGRNRRDVRRNRERSDHLSSYRSCTCSHVGCLHSWRDSFTCSFDHGPWPPAPFPHHAARF